MQQPCECWDGGQGGGKLGGIAVCGNCGSQYHWKRDPYRNESATEEAARVAMERYNARREAQRVVNTRTTDCDKADCGWYSPGRERNCYRDPGDCRYS